MEFHPLTRFTGLDDFDVCVEHGHEIRPSTKVAQLLWFTFRVIGNAEVKSWTKKFFWIEHVSGRIQVISVSGLGANPETIIPFFSGADTISCDLTLTEYIRSCWMFPPHLGAKHIANTSVVPTLGFVTAVTKDYVAMLLSCGGLAPIKQIQLEKYLIQTDVAVRTGCDHRGLNFSTVSSQYEEGELFLPCGVESLLSDALAFGNRLSLDILKAMATYSNDFATEHYNTIASWTGNMRRNRLQAIHLVPWVSTAFNLLAGKDENHYSTANNLPSLSPELVQAIDGAEPFEQLLAQQYQVQRHTIKSVARILNIQRFHQRDIPALLWFLDGMKVDFRPRNQRELQALWPTLMWIYRWQLDSAPEFLRRFGQEVFSNGLAGARCLFRRWCPTHNTHDPSRDLGDFLASHASGGGRVDTTDALLGSLFMERVRAGDFRAFFVASERWHVAQWSGGQIDESLEWPPLIGAPTPVGSLVAHELSNASMLIEEGAAMRHCIASYAARCATGSQFVFSLRTAQGKRRSTLHLVRDSHGRPRIQDHRGAANSTPSAEAQGAAQKLLETLAIRCQGVSAS